MIDDEHHIIQTQIENEITSLWRLHGAEAQKYEPLLLSLMHEDAMKRFFLSGISSGHFLEALSSRSFLHPTGVAKIIISDLSDDLPQLRVHFWLPPKTHNLLGNEDSIHNHKWNFISLLVRGELRHELFEVSSNGLPHHKITFNDSADSKVHKTEYCGIEHLNSTLIHELQSKKVYFLDGDVFHRLRNLEDTIAVTFFLRFPPKRSHTTVYHKNRDSIIIGEYPRRLTFEEINQLTDIL